MLGTSQQPDRGRARVRTLFLLALAAMWPALASAQHTSGECPEQTGAVTVGGSITINITDCASNIAFAGIGDVDGGSSGPPDFEDHGQAVLRITGSQWFLDYSHNGTTGISSTDVFEFTEATATGTGDVRVTITINPASSPITVAPGTLPTLTAGASFTQSLSSSGGVAPYTYTLQSGELPPGVTLTSAGVLSGAPTRRGAYSFSVRSTDSTVPVPLFVDKGYTGSVQNPTLSLAPATATAIQGAPFTHPLGISGGVAPYLCQLESGALPAGLAVSPGCAITGTTSAAAGNYPIIIRVTDSSTGPGTYFEPENFTLTVSPPPSVSIAVSPASVSEDGVPNLVYTVTRSLNLSSPTVVNITTTGTATAGTDYTGGVATVTIPAGATTATITINPTADAVVEADETVVLTVAAGTGYTVGAPSSATGTILNDDVPSATITVSPAAVAEDGVPNLVYTVTLSQVAFVPTPVNFTIAGTAVNGTDYATIASPLVIPAGSTTGTITVNPTADTAIEADETVVLTLVIGAGYTIGVPNSATGTILNDDLPTLSIDDVSASEGNAGPTSFSFTVSLSAPAGPGGVTLDIATADGTATAGLDYVAQSLTAQTIPGGSSTYGFTVAVNGDALNEPDETFFVNVTNVVGATVGDGQGVGTIVNDDPQPALAIDDVTVVEGNAGTTNAVFTVTLSAASGQAVTVDYATADGTANQPVDYTSTSGTLTFTPGTTTRTITVPVIGETVPESDETFFVNLSGAGNATLSDNQGVGTIINDDVPVTVSPGTLPNGAVAAAYSQAVSASGGVAPYTFTVSAGALPAGLSLAPTGTLAGTPTAGGTFNFTLTATDSSPFPGPFAGSQVYTLTIAAPTITLPPTTLPGGTLGAPYSATLDAASGGTAPYSYAITAGALPAGLALNASTGEIEGTPTALGSFNFAITASDSSTGSGPYTSAPRGYAITVIDVPPTASDSSLTVAYNAAATNVPLDLGGGAATGLSITTPAQHGSVLVSDTTVTYQPTTGYAGPDSFAYTATNSGGTSAPATVTITVQDAVITISSGGGFAATVATPYTQTFTFNGGAQPWGGYQVTSLPVGIAITGTTANTVTISGTPTQAGSFTLNVSGTDSSTGNGPYTASEDFTLTVAGPVLALAPAGTSFNPGYGASYSQSFSASGGTGPYTYAATGSLPPGLGFSGDTLSGTPSAPGTYEITITATDTGSTGSGAPFTVAENYTLDIAAPTIAISPVTLPDPAAATPYSEVLTASGGVGPYAFAVSAGSLPAGLDLSGGGALAGTSNQVGSFGFTVTATDANGQSGSGDYTLTIAAPSLAMTPAAGPLSATYGVAYSQAFIASGGSGSFTLAAGGTLPPSLALTGDTLSGTPTAPGNYSFTITATDTELTGIGAPFSIRQAYSIDVAAPVIVVDPAMLPDPVAAAAYSQALGATGGVPPYTFAVTAGSLPPGITLAAGGVLSGIGNEVGSFGFTVTATDANGQAGLRAYTLDIAAPALSMAPPAGALSADYGAAYAQAFTASGGSGSFSYAVSGTLPPGLVLSGNMLAGTPATPGSYAFTITATDTVLTGAGAPFSVAQAYAIDVAAPAIVVDPATLPDAVAADAYTQVLTAGGGVAPYAYAVTAGSLPAGLVLSADGVLAGTGNDVGSYGFTVIATDANGQAGDRAYTLVVSPPPLSLAPAAGALTADYGEPYSQVFTASGGSGSFTYSITGGLPAGLSSSGNTISGTPVATGSYNFTVAATDAVVAGAGAPFSVAQTYTLEIAAPVIVVEPASLPAPRVGVSYDQTLGASGGIAPYWFEVTSGSLPPGLTLGPDGRLSGIPASAGSYSFTITATDNGGMTGDRVFAFGVAPAPAPVRVPAGTPTGLLLTALGLLAIGALVMRGRPGH